MRRQGLESYGEASVLYALEQSLKDLGGDSVNDMQ